MSDLKTPAKKTSQTWSTVLIVAAIVVLFIASLWIGNHFFPAEEMFGGTDAAATEAIEQSGYEPWFTSLFAPSGEIESGLFALQAAIGAGVLGYAIGWYRAKSKSTKGA